MAKRRRPPAALDMDFAEAVARFAQADPAELTDTQGAHERSSKKVSQAKPFVLQLTPQEVALIQQPVGSGGHQSLHAELIAQLAQSGNQLTLNDAQLGRIIRYMTQYGSGGFQGRLHQALRRPLRELLDL
jgi:hypothetical protein